MGKYVAALVAAVWLIAGGFLFGSAQAARGYCWYSLGVAATAGAVPMAGMEWDIIWAAGDITICGDAVAAGKRKLTAVASPPNAASRGSA